MRICIARLRAAILSKPLEAITREDRQLAKAVNFGFIYGQNAEGFQIYAKTQYGITLSLEESAEFRRLFFEQYRGLRQWHKAAWENVDFTDEARTVLGRRLSPNADTDWAKFELLTNYVVQGSAADVIKAAMVKLAYRLPADDHLVATVHDEVRLRDVPAEGANGICELVRMTMVDAFSEVFETDVPIEVEAKVCSSWAGEIAMANRNSRRRAKQLAQQIAAEHQAGRRVSAPASRRRSKWKGHGSMRPSNGSKLPGSFSRPGFG